MLIQNHYQVSVLHGAGSGNPVVCILKSDAGTYGDASQLFNRLVSRFPKSEGFSVTAMYVRCNGEDRTHEFAS